MNDGIDYFNRGHLLMRLQGAQSLRTRRLVYEWFLREVGGVRGKRAIEVGATPDGTLADSNCFLRWLLEDGADTYAASPEDIAHLPERFPKLKLTAWPPRAEENARFDIAISSAVLEHVGGPAEQSQHLRDLVGLADTVLLTTPNRDHWLEFHTKLPLLHWLPREQHRRVLRTLGMPFWASEKNLHLVSKGELARALATLESEGCGSFDLQWFEPRFLGSVSNLVVAASRKRES